MAKKKVVVKKPITDYKISTSTHRYRVKNYYTKFYILPTLEYTYNHDESFYDMCEYWKWRFTLKFLFFGASIIITKDKH